jgi:hypothetical protein
VNEVASEIAENFNYEFPDDNNFMSYRYDEPIKSTNKTETADKRIVN